MIQESYGLETYDILWRLFSKYSLEKTQKLIFQMRQMQVFYKDFNLHKFFPRYKIELYFTKILKFRSAKGKFQDFVNLLLHIAIFLFPKYENDPEFCL